MGQIIYHIISGTSPFTAHVSPDGTIADQVQAETGEYVFDSIPPGYYVLTVTDSLNCQASVNVEIDVNLVTTYVLEFAEYLCEINDPDATTTTSTTEVPTTTTTTTIAVIGDTILTFDNIANVPVAITDPASVAVWNTYLGLPTNGTPYTSVLVNANTVTLTGGANITLVQDKFGWNSHLVSIVDSGCITAMGIYALFSSNYLTTAVLPFVTLFEELTFDGSQFEQASLLTTITLGEGMTSAGLQTFYGCETLTSITLPQSVTNVGKYCFQACYALTDIDLGGCVTLGGSPNTLDTYGSVFDGIAGNTITLTVRASLMTNNGGSPDADIQYLQANNTVTIVTT